MPFKIINHDITKFYCDATVNPTDSHYSAGGGTDFAVHSAAGPQLDEECKMLPPLHFGEVVATSGYNLPCKYVIHTMGPVWTGGHNNETTLLRSCYVNSLLKAHSLGAESIAFPLISSGTFGFPKDKVLRIAIDAISDFLYSSDGDMQVYICIKDRASFDLGKELALQEYLDDTLQFIYANHAVEMCDVCDFSRDSVAEPVLYSAKPCGALPKWSKVDEKSLDNWIKKQDDTFPVMLFKLIDKKGMTDVECYKKANITKGTFYKIRSLDGYKPSKATVLAFAIALELSLEETKQLLKTVGFTLSSSNIADKIIEFYIMNGMYDIYEINAALYKYDQVCLGC